VAPGLSPWARWTGLAALAAVIWLLWSTWLLYPLKILVVFFHELSHGIAALLTGGSIVGIEVVAQEGGVCRTVGGSRFLTLSAGYLGSLVFGGVILVLAARTRRDRELAVGLGALLFLTALVWVRPIFSFGFLFALLAGAALAAAGLYLPPDVVDTLLRGIGLTSIFYAVLDIRDDVLARPRVCQSDAVQLAQLTGIPAYAWGVLWITLALAGGLYFLHLAGRPPRRPGTKPL